MSEFDLQHIDTIINDEQGANWFTAKLLQLIAKADMINISKLYKVYPEEVDAMHKYQNGITYEEFISQSAYGHNAILIDEN